MNYLFWILVGLILGWIIEWIIDWLFWRKPDGQALEKLAAAEAENRRLQAQLAGGGSQQTVLPVMDSEPNFCEAKLADATETLEQLRTGLNTTAAQAPPEEDLLERIEGLWSSFAQRFHDAGVFTFAQLAEAKPEQVREIASPAEWQKVDADQWIGQAKALAKDKTDASQRILAEYRQQEQMQEKLAQIEAENSRLQAPAMVGKDLDVVEPAIEAPVDVNAGFDLGEPALQTRQIQVDEAEATLVNVRPGRRDRLEEIEGIGPAYAKRLNETGIHSFAQLAELTPERVREIIKPESWQKIEPEEWIAQAAAMADPDALEDIVGIGETYARRLNQGGIYTFAQLAQLAPERVAEIAAVEEWQEVDAESWVAQAKGFAFKKAQQTRARGSRTSFSEREDPLVDIDGIGPVYARQLNEAGIVSFWQLAEQTPEQLREIIKPDEWQKIDLESWIAQARLMASPDSLEDINGIGIVFAKRLNEVGIYTFAQLAEQTPERLQEIIQPESWQKIEPEKWIVEARELAAKKSDQSLSGA
jgi:predicted flap endonuclease-1-like 5' DNA nuclease